MADYAFIHNDMAFTPNGTKLLAIDAGAHNAAIEAAELALWATRPDVFCGYVVTAGAHTGHSDKITTWRGKILGYVERSRSRSWRNNFGALITSIVVEGSNGAAYHGRYAGDSGQLVRLRRRKG